MINWVASAANIKAITLEVACKICLGTYLTIWLAPIISIRPTINVANKAKICHIECCSVENTGADNAPTWVETSGVWHNTSAQITEVKCWQSGGGSFATGTTMTILGAEDDVLGYNYPNLTNGTIFEESDTGKHYMFDGTSTWNEM